MNMLQTQEDHQFEAVICSFTAADQLSINLQAKNATVGEGLKGLWSHLSTLRSDSKYSAFYDNVLQSSQ